MKSIFFALVFVLFAFAFTACNDGFETQPANTPAVNASAVQIKVSATASPHLKDGDDNDPEPMFCISGTVTQNGTPVAAEVQLTVTPGNSLVESTNTDGNGGFEFSNVASGSYNLVVIVGNGVASVSEVDL